MSENIEEEFFLIPEEKDRSSTSEPTYKSKKYFVEFENIGYRTISDMFFVDVALTRREGEGPELLFHIKDVPINNRPKERQNEPKHLEEFIGELDIKLREQAHLSMPTEVAKQIFSEGYEKLQSIIEKYKI